MTIQQEAIYTALKIDNDERNKINLERWRERRFALDFMTEHFRNRGERHGRT